MAPAIEAAVATWHPRCKPASTTISVIAGLQYGLDTGSIGSIIEMDAFKADIGVFSNAQQGVFVAVILFSASVATLASGHLADAFSRKQSLKLGAAFMCLGALISASAQNMATLHVARVLYGFGIGSTFAISTLLETSASSRRRPRGASSAAPHSSSPPPGSRSASSLPLAPRASSRASPGARPSLSRPSQPLVCSQAASSSPSPRAGWPSKGAPTRRARCSSRCARATTSPRPSSTRTSRAKPSGSCSQIAPRFSMPFDLRTPVGPGSPSTSWPRSKQRASILRCTMPRGSLLRLASGLVPRLGRRRADRHGHDATRPVFPRPHGTQGTLVIGGVVMAASFFVIGFINASGHSGAPGSMKWGHYVRHLHLRRCLLHHLGLRPQSDVRRDPAKQSSAPAPPPSPKCSTGMTNSIVALTAPSFLRASTAAPLHPLCPPSPSPPPSSAPPCCRTRPT